MSVSAAVSRDMSRAIARRVGAAQAEKGAVKLAEAASPVLKQDALALSAAAPAAAAETASNPISSLFWDGFRKVFQGVDDVVTKHEYGRVV